MNSKNYETFSVSTFKDYEIDLISFVDDSLSKGFILIWNVNFLKYARYPITYNDNKIIDYIYFNKIIFC